MKKNLARWERALSIGAGGALLWLAARHDKPRTSTAATAVGLIARGLTGYCPVSAALGRNTYDTRVALGGDGGVRVRESNTVARPVDEVYRLWRDLSNLPSFMPHIERVDMLSDRRSHWVVRGPGEMRLEWDAEIINDLPDELIAWRSLEGADVVSAGSVRFKPTRRGGTEIQVKLQYAPPAGKAGAWVASLLGSDPSAQIKEDLRRLKHMLESGHAFAEARPQHGMAARAL